MFRFPKKARGHSMCSTMVGGSWRLAVGGSWRLAVGNWRLVAVGGGWRRLVAGGWWLEAVGSGWQLAVGRRWRLAAVGGWRLVAVGGWRLVAVDGSWRLAVGGPLGLSLRAVLSKKKKSRPLRTPLVLRRAVSHYCVCSAKDLPRGRFLRAAGLGYCAVCRLSRKQGWHDKNRAH